MSPLQQSFQHRLLAWQTLTKGIFPGSLELATESPKRAQEQEQLKKQPLDREQSLSSSEDTGDSSGEIPPQLYFRNQTVFQGMI